MPSKSPAQARLMAAAAHTKGGYDGVPQTVGKDFNSADTREKHMARRKVAGQSIRALAAEFGTSKSTAHRKVKAALAQGYTRTGRAT